MSKIMHDLNYVHNYYMDGADNIKLKPAYDSLMDKLPYENREFLLNLMKFLMYSKMISETTKVYLRGKDRTMNAVFVRYNREHLDNQINPNTAKSKINYDRRKLLDYFDDDGIIQTKWFKKLFPVIDPILVFCLSKGQCRCPDIQKLPHFL